MLALSFQFIAFDQASKRLDEVEKIPSVKHILGNYRGGPQFCVSHPGANFHDFFTYYNGYYCRVSRFLEAVDMNVPAVVREKSSKRDSGAYFVAVHVVLISVLSYDPVKLPTSYWSLRASLAFEDISRASVKLTIVRFVMEPKSLSAGIPYVFALHFLTALFECGLESCPFAAVHSAA